MVWCSLRSNFRDVPLGGARASVIPRVRLLGITHHQPVDAPQEPAHASNAVFLPVQIAIRRRSKQ